MNGISYHSKTWQRSAIVASSLLLVAVPAVAQQAVSELDREIYYIQMLSERLMMPDYAEFVLQRVKAKYPEAGPRLKVIQIEQQLAQGKFDEVKKIIAAEADPEAEGTWAMKASLADYLFAYGRYDEAFGIYEGLNKKYADKPPESLASFYRDSMYKYAQMLLRTKKDKKALEIYKIVLKLPMDPAEKRQLQFETAELTINVAAAIPDPKNAERVALLAEGKKACEGILWEQDLWFAKGVALLARIRVISSDIEGAQKLVKSYLPTIKQIDDALMAQGKEQGEDFSRLSPVAQCRFLTGQMLYLEAKKILAEAGDAELTADQRAQVQELLVGKQTAAGKTTGAYQEFINVYVKYPGANDAPEAMTAAEDIEEILVNRKIVKSFKKNITPEQRAEVSKRQFENARVSFNEQNYQEAVDRYVAILNQYPREVPDSINALSELARSYIALINPEDEATAINELYADTTVAHLAETFCNGNGMNAAGEELRRIADAWASEKGNVAKRDAVYDLFFTLYPEHSMAAPMIWANADRAFKAEDYEGALAAYNRLANDYRKSSYSLDALSRIAEIQKKQEKTEEEIATYTELAKRLEETGKPTQRLLVTKFQIASAQRGLVKPEDLRSEEKEVSDAALRNLVGSVKGFQGVQKILDDPAQAPLYAKTDEEKERNEQIREACYMGIAGCYSSLASLKLPDAKVAQFREAAIQSFETVLTTFPKTENGARILNQIGTLWTTAAAKAADEASKKSFNEKADAAFSRLSKTYPESEEAKLALFMQGRALIELGFASEGREKFTQMFKDTSKYKPFQMLAVGDALRDGRQGDLALQAYEDALARADGDEGVLMRASLGKAVVLVSQNKLEEGVAALQRFVETYPKSGLTLDANLQLSRSASKLAADTKDSAERNRLFGVAVKAMKDVRNYYNAKYGEADRRARAAIEAETPVDPEDTATLSRLSGKLAETDNDIGDILILESKALETAGEKDSAEEYHMKAIAHFISVVDAFDPSAADAPERSPHIQKSYRTIVDLMLQIREYEDAATYAKAYLDAFPTGTYLAEIRSKYNEASSQLQ